ncbi:MAG: glycosyltransferase family 4 protein [Acidimicrobiales bacterium]
MLVTPTLPLPFGGADARWLHVVLAELARRGHDVVCLSCTEEPEGRVAQAAQLASELGYRLVHVELRLDSASKVARKLGSIRRPFGEYTRVAELRRQLDDLAQTADVVHLEHLFASRVGLGYENSLTYLHHLEVIDWECRPDLDLRLRSVRLQMQRATRQILRSSPRVLVATSRLAERVASISPGTTTQVVPIAIDTDLYPVLPAPDGLVFGVIGSMHWYPSRSAAERVLTRLWPQIHEQMPEARLVVAGWGSDRYLGHMFPNEGAELMGEVASPEEFFASISTLLYPPERGSGFKVKVLEAMAYGRPVISNAEGLEGLGDRDRPAAVQATTDAEFVDSAVSLMGSAGERQALGAAARLAIETDYSPEPAVDRLLDAYERFGLIGSARARAGRPTHKHGESE